MKPQAVFARESSRPQTSVGGVELGVLRNTYRLLSMTLAFAALTAAGGWLMVDG